MLQRHPDRLRIVSDAKNQALERQAASGDLDVRVSVLRERLRNGEVSREALLHGSAIGDVSEDCYLAGWLGGAEYLVPALCKRVARSGEPHWWGNGTVSPAQALDLLALAGVLGHWADLDDAGVGYVAFDPFPLPPEYRESLDREQRAVEVRALARGLPRGLMPSVDHWFDHDHRGEAVQVLAKLQADLPSTCPDLAKQPEQARKVLVAASRGSKGDLTKLRSLARLALRGWRDVLAISRSRRD